MFRKLVRSSSLLLLICLFVLASANITKALAEVSPTKYVDSLDFEETDLKAALLSLFTKAKVSNYMIDEGVSGKVTYQLRERKLLDDVLTIILSPKNIAWEYKDGLYHIGRGGSSGGGTGISGMPGTDTGAQTKVLTTTVRSLTFANCLDMARTIKLLLTPDGRVDTDATTNSVIVVDVPEKMEDVDKIIKQFDNEGAASKKLISVKLRIVEVTRSSDIDITVDGRYQSRMGNQYNAPVVHRGGTNLGGVSPWEQKTSYQANTLVAVTSDPRTVGLEKIPYLSGKDVGASFIWDLGIYDAFAALYAVDKSSKVNIIAEPDIMVLDGNTAKISIGQRYPTVTTSMTNSGLSTSINYEDINFAVEVKPKMEANGTISVDLKPSIRDIINFIPAAQAGGGVTNVPVVATRDIQTTSFVKNGGTLRIGGMYKDKNIIAETKVPILGDIPLIGLLFKQYKPNTERTSIDILVSPYVVEFYPPSCSKTPWMGQLNATLESGTDVKVDWSNDIPKGMYKFSIFNYRVYRSDEPITSIAYLDPITSDSALESNYIPGESTSWVDRTPKSRGRTYYYVVTAVNASGRQQAISSDPKYNAVITIPEQEY
jgi:type II secretory pathway component GspD/PulD (secretin)